MLLESIIPDQFLNSVVFKMIVACVLGAIIGFERDVHGRAAGLRTMLLVCLGSAVFMILSESIAEAYGMLIQGSVLRADPSRIAAQIITGIGFLGAGAIIKYGFNVRGLTTAACMWISAAIGMGVGAGFIDIAVIATLISLVTLTLLNKFERSYARDIYRVIEITAVKNTDESILIDVIKKNNIRILSLDKDVRYDDNSVTLKFHIRVHYKGAADKLSHQLIEELEKTGTVFHSIKWYH